MYTIEYAAHVRCGDCYNEHCTCIADSIYDVLFFLEDTLEIDCDYTTVNAIYCGTRELDVDKLWHYVSHFDYWEWDEWHYPEDYAEDCE